MPFVQPAELWVESGRWEQYGPELLRIKDRHGRDFVLQPTSEEVITDIARNEIQSWRHLPVNFYHIQTKFRDERRPRFGVMRGREFTMKDAYSFDRDVAGAQKSYQVMFDAYMRIFERLGLTFRAVAADTGSIGGSQSHEFQVIADIGEDLIVYDPRSDYAANIELAPAPCLISERAAPGAPMQSVATPEATKCEMVAEMLKVSLSHTVKSIVLATEQEGKPAQIWLLLLRGDHELNEIKVGKITGLNKGFRFATEAEIVEHFGCKPGYLGPVATQKPVRVVADLTVAKMHDFICGANQEGAHLTGVNWVRDLPEASLVTDLRNVVEGDRAPDGQGTLAIQRGIEVGHVFILARNTPKHSKRLSSMKTANRRSWRWAAMASVSRVSLVPPSSRIMTPKASCGPEPLRRLKWRFVQWAGVKAKPSDRLAKHSTPSSSPAALMSSLMIAINGLALCSPNGSSLAPQCALRLANAVSMTVLSRFSVANKPKPRASHLRSASTRRSPCSNLLKFLSGFYARRAPQL